MKKVISLAASAVKELNYFSPLIDFIVRFYAAWVFLKSGLVKFSSMDTTIWLFTYEYHVPLLHPTLAAYLGTFFELFFPGLLILGCLGRLSAFSLSIVNLTAVISYPDLHDAGIQWHMVWGLLLLIPLFHGPGKLSIDHWLWKKIRA